MFKCRPQAQHGLRTKLAVRKGLRVRIAREIARSHTQTIKPQRMSCNHPKG